MYEREGLTAPHKSAGRQRLYSDEDLERIDCIRTAITERKISIAGMRHLHAMIPCWEIVRCSAAERDACPAFRNHSGGCWTYVHTRSVCAARECRLCEVYRVSGDCSTIKEKIYSLISAASDARGQSDTSQP
jgi:MerR family transcriptional regulator/heat shock protein HspR